MLPGRPADPAGRLGPLGDVLSPVPDIQQFLGIREVHRGGIVGAADGVDVELSAGRLCQCPARPGRTTGDRPGTRPFGDIRVRLENADAVTESFRLRREIQKSILLRNCRLTFSRAPASLTRPYERNVTNFLADSPCDV